MTKMRRISSDPFIWEVVHWFTMTFLSHRIVRGYSMNTGRLLCIYWDPASNWTDVGDDWERKPVPYPKPVWSRRDVQN